MIDKIKKLFKKDEKLSYPSVWGIIAYNEGAIRNGIEDNQNKIILIYKMDYRIEKFKLSKTYGYSDSLLYNLRYKLKIPIYDATEKGIHFPIYGELSLDEINYGGD